MKKRQPCEWEMWNKIKHFELLFKDDTWRLEGALAEWAKWKKYLNKNNVKTTTYDKRIRGIEDMILLRYVSNVHNS